MFFYMEFRLALKYMRAVFLEDLLEILYYFFYILKVNQYQPFSRRYQPCVSE